MQFKKKIFFLLPDLNYGGEQKPFCNIVNFLSKNFFDEYDFYLISINKSDQVYEFDKSVNLIELNIKSEKKTAVSNKSQSGKILTYSITLTFEVAASENKNVLFTKVFTKSQNYSASDVHSDTLNNEKKVVESLIESIASELQIELNSIF